MEFSKEAKKEFEECLTRYPTKQAALLPVLWLAQKEFKVITNDVMEYVAGLLDVSPAHVYGVTTFYTLFNLKPVGKYHIQVCRTLSCALQGAESIVEYLKKKLNIAEGESTPSGKYSLCTVECLASCGSGPAMMINEKYYENLDVLKLDQILDSLK